MQYTPENPPATDYFFQYSWILPEIFDFCSFGLARCSVM
jgi:hypothetical protein